MGRLIRFRIDAIAELLRQLRFAPEETRHRMMAAAEALVADIDPDRAYPLDFVIFRITGYRPEMGESTEVLSGDALLAELATLIMHLSQGLTLAERYDDREPLSMAEVSTVLGVTSKTVQRYRRRGLIFHSVMRGDGGRRVVCFRDHLESFRGRHASPLREARKFTRVSETDEAAMIATAREWVASKQLSLSEIARRLARRHGRAHETVRGVLRRHDEKAARPIFDGVRSPLDRRRVLALERAWRRGLPLAEMARRYDRSSAAIQRVINVRRLERIAQLGLKAVEFPTFSRPDAEQVLLRAPVVTTDLWVRPFTFASDLVASAHDLGPPADADVDGLGAAYNFLKRRVIASVATIPAWPRSADVDAVETDLRWAGLLKRRLVALGFSSGVIAIEQHLHRPVLELPAETVVLLLERMVDVIGDVVETLDPSRGQRFGGRVSYELDRALTPLALQRASGRAAARREPATIAVAGLFDGVVVWPWLMVTDEQHDQIAALESQHAKLLTRRYGLDGSPPLSSSAIAVLEGSSGSGISRRLQRAEAARRTLARPAQ